MRSESTDSTTPERLQRRDGAGVTGDDPLHSGPDIRSLGAQQRNRLALHIRTHERAVGVVVFKEGDERSGDRDQLLRADVHILDLIAVDEDEVALLAGVDQVGGHLALGVRASTFAWAMMYLSSSHAER